jgi:basic membrane protein A
LGDRGFNDLAKEGLDSASAELGVEGQVLEPAAPTDYGSILDQLAETGAGPIFGVGFSFADVMSEVAPNHPDTQFAIIDAVVEEPNVASLVFREEEGSYLAGVVAGLMTSVETAYTNPDDQVVGFLGGAESPLIQKFEAGFTQGVLSVCPDCEILSQYIGATAEAFRDPAAAAEIARVQRSSGADVIYHAAGGSGAGLFDVATSEDFFAIGVNTDQATLFPDAPILTSMLKRVNAVVEATILAAADGSFEAAVISSGIEEGAISLTGFGQFEDDVPDEVRTAVEEAEAGILDGSITVPSTLDAVTR